MGILSKFRAIPAESPEALKGNTRIHLEPKVVAMKSPQIVDLPRDFWFSIIQPVKGIEGPRKRLTTQIGRFICQPYVEPPIRVEFPDQPTSDDSLVAVNADFTPRATLGESVEEIINKAICKVANGIEE